MAKELVFGCYGGSYILFLSLPLYTFDLLDLQKIIYYILVQDLRKGTIPRYFRIFILKRFYLRNHSSSELEAWHKYSSIIQLHSLRIASHAHFLCGRGRACMLIAFENRRFMPLLSLAQEACCRSVK